MHECDVPDLVLDVVTNPATYVDSAMANEFGIHICGGSCCGMGVRLVVVWMSSTVHFIVIRQSQLP